MSGDGLRDKAPFGPNVVNGRLFFKLLDGSTVACECIGEPYASMIVATCCSLGGASPGAQREHPQRSEAEGRSGVGETE